MAPSSTPVDAIEHSKTMRRSSNYSKIKASTASLSPPSTPRKSMRHSKSPTSRSRISTRPTKASTSAKPMSTKSAKNLASRGSKTNSRLSTNHRQRNSKTRLRTSKLGSTNSPVSARRLNLNSSYTSRRYDMRYRNSKMQCRRIRDLTRRFWHHIDAGIFTRHEGCFTNLTHCLRKVILQISKASTSGHSVKFHPAAGVGVSNI